MIQQPNLVKEFNLTIFKFFNNAFSSPNFEQAKTLINNIGDPKYFFYHLAVMILIASFLIYRKKDNNLELKKLLTLGFASAFTLVAALALGLGIVELLKHYTTATRPFCGLTDIHVLAQSSDGHCHKSFPSGHLSYSIIVVTSFWLVLNRFFKSMAAIFIILLGISRMASGAHYPMDLLGSIAVCLPLTICIRVEMLKFTKYLSTKVL